MSLFDNLGKKKIVLGLIHLKPLPGTPLYKEGDMQMAMEKAIKDSIALYQGGADGCLVQTVDRIYPSGDDTDYARVSAMSVIIHEVKKATGPKFKIGVQLMWNCITPSLAIAKVCGASFTRCTALIGTTTSAFGLINANPLKVQMYRRNIGAQDVAMIAEIEGYHFHWLGGELPIQQKAQMAMMAGADGVEVLHADEKINNQMVHDIKSFNPDIPVVLGGKTNLENVARRMKEADAVLVGSCFENNKWGSNVDEKIVSEYVKIVRTLEK
ncbi:MAG TPA: BtpA family membrane complex biogenesis protein [Anaerolineae bacterium]|nr:BtpA family membrane complex biogenesis protein [Anaerolineae bacterium]